MAVNWWRRLATVAVLATGLAATGPALAADDDASPKAITVVMDDNYPPYIFRSADGTLQGILRDAWELWSRRTGIHVNLLAMDWGRARRTMEAGGADVIDTIFETPERRKSYDFSKPYATLDVPIYVHRSISGISNVDTLRGFTIGVKDGDACADWLEERGIKSLRRYSSYETMIEAAGRHDVRLFCADQPPASHFLYKKSLEGQFRHTAPLYSGQFHRAYRKGNQHLATVVENGFAGITAAEWDRIEAKWMGTALPSGVHYLEKIIPILGLAAAGGLLLGVWTWSLRRQVRARTRQLEAALASLGDSERHYRELVGLTPVGMFETDANGACVFANQPAAGILGCSPQDMLGYGWTGTLHPDDRQRVTGEWTRSLETGGMFQSEYRFLAPDGRVTWVLGQASPRHDGEGRLDGYIGTITDITPAKNAEAALAASEGRFRAIFDNINDAIFIHRTDGDTVMAVNRRMLEMYGFDDESEVIGAPAGRLSEGVPPYDEASAHAWLAKARAGQPQLFEWHARRRDGSLFWVEVGVRRASMGTSGDALLVVVRDISERKQAELALTERTEALERSNADLEQFAYVASHDLREPLRMISSYMALLERRYGERLDKDGHEFIAYAKEGAIRMDRLVQDLLEFSRVGRIADPPAPVSAETVLANVVKVLRAVIAEARAEIVVPQPLPEVVCSANELFLLFQNLISNAVKFRSPDRSPVIRVTTEMRDGHRVFAVADNGIGIEPIYFDRIFKIFSRLHTRDHYDGTGIGLSICKKIVERHGGRIWIESVPGEGATFLFTLGEGA
ncbi:PAS domain S-box protein [Magnetospirillum sp. SS-4]|uniref:PAS domain S-box protein n=1 Tax=Magnetospirillum sp. SS-4 TaxID=2681465 RepID=UPI00137CED17|nr:PAS domain S-box protein [Magnetospirillum sp. SS-4]CAA7623109.1 putative Histidine kinase [Magnetospirillum sp. SS-4]